MNRQLYKLFTGAFVALFLFGCAMSPRLENPEDYIGAAYATVEATANTVANMYQRGVIDQEEAKRYYRLLVVAYDYIHGAETLANEGKPKSSMEMLRLAQRVLTQVERELRERSHERNGA